MINQMKPIRRVVTGNDAQGRSRVLYDGPAPNVAPRPENPRGGMTDLWVYGQSPAPLSGERDDGALPYHFEPPHTGGHLRIVQSTKPPAGLRSSQGHELRAASRAARARRRRAGARRPEPYTSPMHKSETVDYGIMLAGERVLVLDDGRRW